MLWHVLLSAPSHPEWLLPLSYTIISHVSRGDKEAQNYWQEYLTQMQGKLLALTPEVT